MCAHAPLQPYSRLGLSAQQPAIPPSLSWRRTIISPASRQTPSACSISLLPLDTRLTPCTAPPPPGGVLHGYRSGYELSPLSEAAHHPPRPEDSESAGLRTLRGQGAQLRGVADWAERRRPPRLVGRAVGVVGKRNSASVWRLLELPMERDPWLLGQHYKPDRSSAGNSLRGGGGGMWW